MDGVEAGAMGFSGAGEVLLMLLGAAGGVALGLGAGLGCGASDVGVGFVSAPVVVVAAVSIGCGLLGVRLVPEFDSLSS